MIHFSQSTVKAKWSIEFDRLVIVADFGDYKTKVTLPISELAKILDKYNKDHDPF
jgi:hypothetical protein